MSEADSLPDLDAAQGPQFWRTLEEWSQTEGFRALLQSKLPSAVALLDEGIDRRRFLSLLGASLALAGLAGCAQAPVERIHPYVRTPERITLGRPLWFATAMPLAGYATGGLLVESHEGRPTKVEGNPDHPGSPRPGASPQHAAHGPTDVFAQASILSLYDPDRSRAVLHRGNPSSWEAFRTALGEELRRRPARELGLRILTGTVTSPTLARQLRTLLRQFPQARWHQWEPAGCGNELEGAHLAFGRYVETHYDFARADCILSLDADFLACGPGHLRYVRDFSDRRRVWTDGRRANMNRLYVVESMMTATGAKADHRIPLRPGLIEAFARAVASRLGVAVGDNAPGDAAFGLPAGWIDAVVRDLQSVRGRSLVLAGAGQAPVVHALAHAMNQRLGGFASTVHHTEPIAAAPVERVTEQSRNLFDHAVSLSQLVEDLRAGSVDILLIVGGNPLYTAPADLELDRLLASEPVPAANARPRYGWRIHLGTHYDETAANCHWHLPEAHYLESWGDVRSQDGTVTLMQPLIAPLYNGRTAHEVLSLFTGQSERTSHEIVRADWRRLFNRANDAQDELRGYADFRPSGDFEAWWQNSLNRGFVEGTQAARVRDLELRADLSRAGGAGQGGEQTYELIFRPDPSVFDGSFANNGWLQELPRPFSSITWDNAVYLSPATALRLGIAPDMRRIDHANGRLVRIRDGERTLTAPAWVLPGHADGCVTVTLGYGRSRAGRVATGPGGGRIGFNAYTLRTSSGLWAAGGVRVEGTLQRVSLAVTQSHHLMENRDLVRTDTLAHFRGTQPPQGPQGSTAERDRMQPISLYPPRDYSQGHKWGMAIDLNLCTGCRACVVACQSENNIPVVGKEEVARSREMHWLRIDNYFAGSPERPRELTTYFQPLPCMHCENAPCELVCPVEATVHSHDGLNDMVYNRCVGTRYCSNNCPYKVRRFNFLQYSDFATENLRLMRNPEVTVRSRGVMEKCTYCVQRIRGGEIQANVAGDPLRDGDVQTACQAACPAGAIVFGDLNLAGSKVAQMEGSELNYGLLTDLNTRPRTTYMKAFKNPNPEIERLEV